MRNLQVSHLMLVSYHGSLRAKRKCSVLLETSVSIGKV